MGCRSRRSRTLTLAVGILLLPLLFSPADATTYYVGKTGSDGNSCGTAQTSTTPKLTIAGGAGCLSAGDTLIVKAGTYVEDMVDIVPSGTAGSPTTVQNASGETVIVAPVSQPSNWLGGIFVTRDRHYITLDGFIFDLANYTSVNAYVVEVFGPLDHHITIQHCEIRNATVLTGGAGASGFVVGAGSSFIIMRNNKVHHVGPSADNPVGPPAHGFYIGGATDSLFENNEAYNNQGYGFQMWTQYAGYTNSRNIVRNNSFHGHPNKAGMLVSSGDSIQAYQNLVYENGEGIQVGGYGFDTTNAHIYNNTVYANTRACVLLGSSGQNNVTGTIVRNTICWQNGTDDVSPLGGITYTADHNLMGIDPLFTNPSADLTLRAGSVAINTGVDVGLSYVGSAPDIGALEYSLPVSPSPNAFMVFFH